MTKQCGVLTVLSAFICCAAFTAQAAVVSFNPPDKVVNVGDVFQVAISGSSFASNLDGGGLNLSFNRSVLEVQDVIIDPASWDFFVDKGTIDNLAGTVEGIQFNQFGHPKVGSFNIAQVQFRAKDVGTSLLQLSEWDGNPFASGGEPVSVTFESGSLQVVPEPGSAWLLLAGLALLPLVRRLSS